jgi:hypothetical protein
MCGTLGCSEDGGRATVADGMLLVLQQLDAVLKVWRSVTYDQYFFKKISKSGAWISVDVSL